MKNKIGTEVNLRYCNDRWLVEVKYHDRRIDKQISFNNFDDADKVYHAELDDITPGSRPWLDTDVVIQTSPANMRRINNQCLPSIEDAQKARAATREFNKRHGIE